MPGRSQPAFRLLGSLGKMTNIGIYPLAAASATADDDAK